MSTKSPNSVDKHVGSRVRMRRLMLGISQEKLGEALGLTFQQVQKYEKGTNRVGASRIQQICEIFQVPVSFLFEGSPTAISKAEGLSEAPSPAYVYRFSCDIRRSRADPRIYPDHRAETPPQHRQHGRADCVPRSARTYKRGRCELAAADLKRWADDMAAALPICHGWRA